MKKLYKYLDALDLAYEKTTFGGNYFRNAAPLCFDGAFITLCSSDINTDAWHRLERYCRRWGYSLRSWGGFPGYTTFRVCLEDDDRELRRYLDYQARSVEVCERAIHLRATGQGFSWLTDAEFNDHLAGIMDFWGEEMNSRARAAA